MFGTGSSKRRCPYEGSTAVPHPYPGVHREDRGIHRGRGIRLFSRQQNSGCRCWNVKSCRSRAVLTYFRTTLCKFLFFTTLSVNTTSSVPPSPDVYHLLNIASHPALLYRSLCLIAYQKITVWPDPVFSCRVFH